MNNHKEHEQHFNKIYNSAGRSTNQQPTTQFYTITNISLHPFGLAHSLTHLLTYSMLPFIVKKKLIGIRSIRKENMDIPCIECNLVN